MSETAAWADAPKRIEDLRRILNQASSIVPDQLEAAFSAALDQVADQQYNACLSLASVLEKTCTEDEAKKRLRVAIEEAERTALRACRGYADDQAEAAKPLVARLHRLPTNTAELLITKQNLDKLFSSAIELHERNDIEALDRLVSVASEYKSWTEKVAATELGTMQIAKSDHIRKKLQIIAIVAAVLLGLANLVWNIVKSLGKL